MAELTKLFTFLIKHIWLFIIKTPWLNIFQGLGTCTLAMIAFMALNTWKRQLSAERKINFLDELTEALNEYIQFVRPAISSLSYIRTGIDSHEDTVKITPPEVRTFQDSTVPNDIGFFGTIQYIKSYGKTTSERLNLLLDKGIPSLSKVSSLEAKGQVYDFKNYPECQTAYRTMMQQHERIRAIATMIGSDSYNWQNEMVQDM